MRKHVLHCRDDIGNVWWRDRGKLLFTAGIPLARRLLEQGEDAHSCLIRLASYEEHHRRIFLFPA
jgi:hypothetical protein